MIHRRMRLGVLISGSGTNLQAIIDASEAGALEADVVVVISNHDAARGLRARQGARHRRRLHRPRPLATRFASTTPRSETSCATTSST